jgi:hypothetical protein
VGEVPLDASSQTAAEKTYRAIGRFIFEFSQIEYAVRYYLAEEIGLKEEHFTAVVESYDVGVLITVAKKVFKKSRGEKEGSRIEKLLSRFQSLNVDRNRIAHGLWVPFTEGGALHHVSRNSLTPTRLTDQARALEKLADDACTLRAELETAFMAVTI